MDTFNPDMAMVQLDRTVTFIRDFISPICVPSNIKFPDKPKEAYVAGWGASKHSCDTTEHGPEPHTMCKFPFKYKGQVLNRCTRLPTPASDNPICGQLFKWAKSSPKLMKTLYPDMHESGSLRVYFWDTGRKKASYTTCYR
jgi:hypothetical protein